MKLKELLLQPAASTERVHPSIAHKAAPPPKPAPGGGGAPRAPAARKCLQCGKPSVHQFCSFRCDVDFCAD